MKRTKSSLYLSRLERTRTRIEMAMSVGMISPNLWTLSFVKVYRRMARGMWHFVYQDRACVRSLCALGRDAIVFFEFIESPSVTMKRLSLHRLYSTHVAVFGRSDCLLDERAKCLTIDDVGDDRLVHPLTNSCVNRYAFLGYTENQLKGSQFMIFEGDKAAAQRLLRKFGKLESVYKKSGFGKYAARLGLSFSSTKGALDVGQYL